METINTTDKVIEVEIKCTDYNSEIHEGKFDKVWFQVTKPRMWTCSKKIKKGVAKTVLVSAKDHAAAKSMMHDIDLMLANEYCYDKDLKCNVASFDVQKKNPDYIEPSAQVVDRDIE